MRDRGSNARREPYDPNPTLTDNQPPASRAPLVQFATPEAAHTVTGPIREKYENAVALANAEWEQAFKAQADVDAWLGEIADLQKKIDARALDKQQHLHHAQQACDVANPASVLLGMTGVHVPQIAAPPAVTSPAPGIPSLRVSDLKVHPLDTSKPLGSAQDAPQGSPFDNPSVGHCIHCGQEVWRTERTETSPNGLTHGWGASCDPHAQNPQYADMGEDRERAS
ncbi:hypothetical protein [Sphaerisporangium sp. TRM90804]|uniref:hypothetical protein n=1 Tax=Sphaerisporangium sp. TRM90804 TaxID=3031113 RepID=UPI00244A211E|nr:hypothetical protein [Sphaerisporangium sp. TRM90804]MDH2424834.1 hypothetical protein [Sphaerisporangium sp. TRM90804]